MKIIKLLHAVFESGLTNFSPGAANQAIANDIELHIAEEVLREEIDHKEIERVVSAASKLLGAVKEFKKKATHEMQNSLTAEILAIHPKLEAMLKNPQSWITRQRRIVALKPTNTDNE